MDLQIDDMDRFFFDQWQALADDIAKEPIQTPQLEELRQRAQAKADHYYRDKIMGASR